MKRLFIVVLLSLLLFAAAVSPLPLALVEAVWGHGFWEQMKIKPHHLQSKLSTAALAAGAAGAMAWSVCLTIRAFGAARPNVSGEE